jgi:hypothetical protein
VGTLTTPVTDKFQLGKDKDKFDYTFPYYVVVNAVNYDTYGIWTSLKNVLTLLNVTRYRIFKS